MALWARVQSAEKEHRAAEARYEAFGVLDPSTAPPEYGEAERSESLAWVRAEQARHELDAFLHPKRYYKKGHRPEALDKFRAKAEPGEPEDRREAHGGPAVTEPGPALPRRKQTPVTGRSSSPDPSLGSAKAGNAPATRPTASRRPLTNWA